MLKKSRVYGPFIGYGLGFLVISILVWGVSRYTPAPLAAYVKRTTEEAFGNQHLQPVIVQKIEQLLTKMGYEGPVQLRKMNASGLQMWGYYNAMVYFPKFLGIIPVAIDPYIFISEGFLEDLSEKEQQFILGHEIIHLKEGHAKWLSLISILGFLAMVLCFCCLRKKINLLIQACIPLNYQVSVYKGLIAFLIVVSVGGMVLIIMAYSRSIEKQADRESLQMLKTYEGCLATIERWQKDFKMQLHNPWNGWFASHPSPHERKEKCLLLQKNDKDTA